MGAGYAYYQVLSEWAHRLIAGVLLGPLVLLIGALAWRVRSANPRLPAYGAGLILLLLVQAGLGGLTVLDQNSPWSVALHLSTALALFSLLWLILARAHAGIGPAPAPDPLAGLVWLLALGTMASAAMMTKSGAALACPTWPLCAGAVIPDLGDPLVRLNFTHRLLAAATGAGLLAVTLRVRSKQRPLAGLVLVLMAGQIALGGLVVKLGAPLWAGLVHQAFGVLAFGLLSWLLWRSGSDAPPIRENPAYARLSGA
jgi:cytochrome c oxidase assembly protein subunit 15